VAFCVASVGRRFVDRRLEWEHLEGSWDGLPEALREKLALLLQARGVMNASSKSVWRIEIIPFIGRFVKGGRYLFRLVSDYQVGSPWWERLCSSTLPICIFKERSMSLEFRNPCRNRSDTDESDGTERRRCLPCRAFGNEFGNLRRFAQPPARGSIPPAGDFARRGGAV